MKTSIVISVLNEEKLIDSCLEHLNQQTVKPYEVIIVDNGCTDRSVEIAKSLGARIVIEPQKGIWAARATGYDAAKGDIIVCCDADTMVPNDWVERIEKHFKLDALLLGLTGPGVFYDTNTFGRVFGRYWYMRPYFFFVGLGLGHDTLFGSNFMIRKSAWKQIRGQVCSHTESVFDDIDTAMHLGLIGKILYDPTLEVGISFRPLRHPIGMMKRYAKALRTIFSHWPALGPWKFIIKDNS